MSAAELAVLMNGETAGVLRQDGQGRLAFVYADSYQTRSGTPLSLSMPLSVAAHGGKAVRAFLLGLLPDSELVLDRWGRQFGVSAGNPFALLSHVGQDCAGAAQFVPFERVEQLQTARRQRCRLDGTSAAAR